MHHYSGSSTHLAALVVLRVLDTIHAIFSRSYKYLFHRVLTSVSTVCHSVHSYLVCITTTHATVAALICLDLKDRGVYKSQPTYQRELVVICESTTLSFFYSNYIEELIGIYSDECNVSRNLLT